MAVGNRGFNVLRVVIAPVDDNQILATADNEQFSTVEKPEIAGPQEGAFTSVRNRGSKNLFGLGFAVPVSARHTWSIDPDLANFAIRALLAGLRIDDPHNRSLYWPTAADKGLSPLPISAPP